MLAMRYIGGPRIETERFVNGSIVKQSFALRY
jgi:hypothetical protein